jgi:tetratricopeptide (TPR) repeat protein
MKNTLYIFILLLPFLTNAQNKKTHLRNGNNLYEDSLFNDAEMKYRKSLQKDQDYFTASYNLADAVYKQERFEESSSLFEGLIDNAKTKNEKAKLYHNLGNSLFKQQKLKESIQAYKYALKNNPKDEETRHNLAFAQKMLQQQEENQQEQEENQEEKNEEEKGENQEEKQQQEQRDKQEQKQQEKQQQEKEDMSKEDAEKMLEALQQQEKELQEKMQKKKVKGKKVKVLKDW